ncbi:lipase 3-like [Ochlerotatus camptorhynchus]|uniref:lipase 3-like n=1 Tax=Ochlerotatus camptorhynchus TaxID=644619 RepID=UPI0031D4D43A
MALVRRPKRTPVLLRMTQQIGCYRATNSRCSELKKEQIPPLFTPMKDVAKLRDELVKLKLFPRFKICSVGTKIMCSSLQQYKSVGDLLKNSTVVFYTHDLPSVKPLRTAVRRSIEKHGYPAELHSVITEDGYTLTLSRIPSPRKTPILLLHQVYGCSIEFTMLGPGKALALLAHDDGYDVWMGNVRGNMFSRGHLSLDPNRNAYWDYSYHEIGAYDLPAMVDYILFLTGKQKLHYVGHSQGAAVFLVMASMQPKYNAKVISAHLSAPPAFLSKATSPAGRVSGELLSSLQLMESLGIRSVGDRFNSEPMMYLKQAIDVNVVSEEWIMETVYFLTGEDRDGFNMSIMSDLTAAFPAGGSIRQFMHFMQCYRSGRFAQFDHGKAGNTKRYGHSTPPAYALDLVTAPVAIYYGSNDRFVSAEDVKLLAKKLPNVVLRYLHPNPKWNHIDFLYSVEAPQVYRHILNLIRSFERR